MYMSLISGQNYFSFINMIQKMCLESQIQIKNEKGFDALLKEQIPRYSVPALEVKKEISKYVVNKLVLYVAARQSNVEFLADVYLNKWTKKLDAKITRKMESLSSGGKQKEISLDDKIQKIMHKIVKNQEWPEISLEIAEATEKALTDKLQNIIAKDLVFSHFHKKVTAAPQHVVCFSGNLELARQEQYLINKYEHLIEEISFSNDLKKSVTDKHMSVYLSRYKHAKLLDISECLTLAPKCLSYGHPLIEKIILTGASIHTNAVPRAVFPSLVEVVQESYFSVKEIDCERRKRLGIHGNSSIWNYSWEELKLILEQADTIITDENRIETRLLEKFRTDPCKAGIETLLSYKVNCGKIKRNSKGWNFSKQEKYPVKMVRAFVTYLTQSSQDLLNPELMKLLLEMVFDPKECIEAKNLINEYFLAELTLTLDTAFSFGEGFNTETRSIKGRTEYLTTYDMQRKRLLLCMMEEKKCAFPGSYLQEVHEVMTNLVKQLLQKRENSYGDATHYMLRSLNELYLHMLHHVRYDDSSCKPFEEGTKNPYNLYLNHAFGMFRSNNPFYSDSLGQTLACVFVQKMPLAARETILREILAGCEDYVSSTQYALPKIIIGVLFVPEDVPTYDKESYVLRYLKDYKGVFSEKISQELKDEYWAALLKGKLGGYCPELIDGLAAYYKLKTTPQDKKQQIMELFNAISKKSIKPAVSLADYTRKVRTKLS